MPVFRLKKVGAVLAPYLLLLILRLVSVSMPKYKGQILKKIYGFVLLSYLNNITLSQRKAKMLIRSNKLIRNSTLYSITKLSSYMFIFLNTTLYSLKKDAAKGFNYSALCYYILATTVSLTENSFFLVSCHREENIDDGDNFSGFTKLLQHLAESEKLPVIVSTHPRTRKRIEQASTEFSSLVNFMKPLGFKDYLKLQLSAKVVFSDSGTITEESSILNFPAINIRDAHERPEGMEEGSVMMTGMNLERIQQAMGILENQPAGTNRLLNIVSDYESSNVSEKVVRIIHSYTDYINRKVWQKK